MKLAAHELQDLNELTMSCVNSVTSMAYMLDHVQDQELKQLLERHFPFHVRDYNMKVEFLNKVEGATTELPLFKEDGKILSDYTQSNMNAYPPVQPRVTVTDMNDREMATNYLLTLKRAGREYAWSAMESANPEIRSFLQTAFMMSCSHAYEAWQYMVSKGYYPLEPADQAMTTKIGAMYQIVPEDQQKIQAMMMKYDGQNPIAGSSDQMYQ
ncbi:spore coat protein [Paraliobacillus sp. X-1268]|uniref:spore coat protein n=1 Tax=Paraliobacillus sp. X-1268 TaxID=2213193 RepID=UPI000E3BBAEC|nr:spore coat protein [Paraliobacillus sp. X-1268]